MGLPSQIHFNPEAYTPVFMPAPAPQAKAELCAPFLQANAAGEILPT